mgnify:CR=1 FL=1|tara:strand:- start:566 stop:730 length:165 start_codon:yes stop_codon:yes gene_type:complete
MSKEKIITKIQLEKETMKTLKNNKRVNGMTVGWVMQKAVEEYIVKHKLNEIPNV